MIFKGNGGTINTNHKAYVNGYGGVWFDERDITNILVFNNVNSKFIVTYDSNNDLLFIVHKTSSQYVHFNIHKDGLQYHDTKNRLVALFQTVRENEVG